MLDAFLAVRDFMEKGGDVLYLILFVLLIMWVLIIERFWYFVRIHPKVAKEALGRWNARSDQTSWYASQIRRQLANEVQGELESSLLMIKTCVALCPLLGLLGTVTGMIEVFDVMAIAGSGNARAMAEGVSKATVPTMSGMVAALSGVVISVQMDRYAREEGERFADSLVHS